MKTSNHALAAGMSADRCRSADALKTSSCAGFEDTRPYVRAPVRAAAPRRGQPSGRHRRLRPQDPLERDPAPLELHEPLGIDRLSGGRGDAVPHRVDGVAEIDGKACVWELDRDTARLAVAECLPDE